MMYPQSEIPYESWASKCKGYPKECPDCSQDDCRDSLDIEELDKQEESVNE